jgi:hypothetical protein
VGAGPLAGAPLADIDADGVADVAADTRPGRHERIEPVAARRSSKELWYLTFHMDGVDVAVVSADRALAVAAGRAIAGS